MKRSAGINAVGRRKTSIARVYLKTGTGQITVNGAPYEEYFGRKTSRMIVRQPLDLLSVADKFDVQVNVTGGGVAGQAGAVRLGIARALIKTDAALRPALKGEGYLSRDSREVERKKYGHRKARRRPQYSKR